MKITEDLEERIAIIQEGCKVSRDYAVKMYQEQQKAMTLSPNAYADKIKRIQEMARLQAMKIKHKKTW